MDAADIVAHFADDRELAVQMIGCFLDTAPGLEVAVEQALARGDADEVWRAAHTLKGALCHFAQGEGVLKLAERLEAAGRAGQLDQAAERWTALGAELPRFRAELTRVRDELVGG